MTAEARNEKKLKRIIMILSVAIPLVVAALFGMEKVDGVDTSFLPPIYASVNGLTAILLVLALMAIKSGNRQRHELLIKICMGCSAAFLAMYVTYHLTSDSTEYGGTGAAKAFYYFVLITHIVLSVVVVPFVLFTYLRAYLGKFEQHKKIARVAFPLWLYVAVSGVVVYLMISPYYS